MKPSKSDRIRNRRLTPRQGHAFIITDTPTHPAVPPAPPASHTSEKTARGGLHERPCHNPAPARHRPHKRTRIGRGRTDAAVTRTREAAHTRPIPPPRYPSTHRHIPGPLSPLPPSPHPISAPLMCCKRMTAAQPDGPHKGSGEAGAGPVVAAAAAGEAVHAGEGRRRRRRKRRR